MATERIDVWCKDIHDNLRLVKCETYTNIGKTVLYASLRDLKTLVIPDCAQEVYCHGNYLTELVIPEAVRYIQCDKELFDYETCKIQRVMIRYEK